eukprot:4007540-Ditylum_brightwellii.AAC.1
MAGFRKGTWFQAIEPKDLAEFEHIVAILRENYKALDVQNEIGSLEKHCTDKGWKLSVCQKPGIVQSQKVMQAKEIENILLESNAHLYAKHQY